MKLPFISIIVPTLNEEKLIENCLKSIKNQDYKGKYEIIVADGKSKDKTVQIARKYTDKVIIVKRKGRPAGLNEGAKHAKGEILFFVDADCVLLPNTLTVFAKAFKSKKVVGATCPVTPLNAKMKDFLIYWLFNQFSKSSIKLGKPQISIVFGYRKEVFEKVGGFKEDVIPEEDLDLSLRIGKHGKIVFIDDALVLTSPRRLEKWGRTKAARIYISSYLNYFLRGKTLGFRKYKPIR
ncbi:MAG: glycosyltransferase [Candidatus Aenigmatarchaeota archaeon]